MSDNMHRGLMGLALLGGFNLGLFVVMGGLLWRLCRYADRLAREEEARQIAKFGGGTE